MNNFKMLLVAEAINIGIPILFFPLGLWVIYGINPWVVGVMVMTLLGICMFPKAFKYWFDGHIKTSISKLDKMKKEKGKMKAFQPNINGKVDPKIKTEIHVIPKYSVELIPLLYKKYSNQVNDLKLPFVIVLLLVWSICNLGSIFCVSVMFEMLLGDTLYAKSLTALVIIGVLWWKHIINKKFNEYFRNFDKKMANTFERSLSNPFSISLDSERISFTDKNIP